MTQKVKKILERLIETIKERYKPEKIILFGSYACGTYTKDSDIDLLIVTNEAQRLKFKHQLLNTFSIPLYQYN